MAYRVQITARAEFEIDEALDRLRQSSASSAARWYAGLMTAIESLEQLPERCGLAPEAEDLGVKLRQLLFGKRRNEYRILFTIRGDVVNVLHLRHAARRPLQPGDL
jgi:plasmid stabilization system protein ParE